MGNVENITYDRFPRQKSLGHLVGIGQDRSVSAVVVRWDDEPPHRAIFRTGNQEYFDFSELESLQLPRQGEYLGRDAEVCFHYGARTLRGKIVRDDVAEPFKEIIVLEDGRTIFSTECQYRPLSQEIKANSGITQVSISSDVLMVERQLSRRDSSERLKLLSGIYQQLVEGRNGKTHGGVFHYTYGLHQKGNRHFVQLSPSAESIDALTGGILRSVKTQEFVRFLAREMRKHPQLKNHAYRLESFYSGGNVQLDLRGEKFAEIKRV